LEIEEKEKKEIFEFFGSFFFDNDAPKKESKKNGSYLCW